jgi:hypothetical protein
VLDAFVELGEHPVVGVGGVMTDRRLNVPKPCRKVDAFKAPAAPAQPAVAIAPADLPPAEPAQSTPSEAAGRRTAKLRRARSVKPARARVSTNIEMVRVHTTLSPGVEEAEVAKYEALGFRPPRNAKPPKGRMGTTFYMSTKARASLDEAAAAGRFASRSAFIDALLRRALVDG